MSQFSGIQPTGDIHIGNYFGAIRQWARHHQAGDVFAVVNLSAMTTSHNPDILRARTRETLAILLAAGINPNVAEVFVQSDLITEHSALHWILECVVTYGELARMTQFKDKASGQAGVRAGLFTYPVLMAADILLYGTTTVPVGDDQRQHLELARVLVKRFNQLYGEIFTAPEGVVPPVCARVADLAYPEQKMAKSAQNHAGVVHIMDSPDVIRRKVRRAVTDQLETVRYAPECQPGVSNLLEILAACTGHTPHALAREIPNYGQLKDAVADALIAELQPIRTRTTELLADRHQLDCIRSQGAEKARARVQPRLSAALAATGLQ